MRNPFVYGEEAADEAFCNRQSEIAELIRDIGNGVNVIIFSPRRYGKTSLIKQVLRKLDNKRTAAVYEKYADQHGMNAVVVLDDIQEFLQYEDDEIEKAMRSAFQSQSSNIETGERKWQ